MDSGGFGSTRSDPVYHYHSVFDSERWQEVYGDPGFVKHVGLTSQRSKLALTSFQVAIAKNLGLQTLRLASALVLPFNTTHYAFELENYLNRSAKPSQAYLVSDMHFGRVEGLVTASSAAVNLIPLRAAIKSLQFASIELDAEKFAAERVLKRYLRKWRKQHPGDNCFKRSMRRPKGIFTTTVSQEFTVYAPTLANGRFPQSRVDGTPAWIQEQRETEGADVVGHESDSEVDVRDGRWPHFPLPNKPKRPHHPHWPHPKPPRMPRKFIKAVKAVRKINQKLASFERGFIHEDGIKDREWYRHLGVAPGKWLGKSWTISIRHAETDQPSIRLRRHHVAGSHRGNHYREERHAC